MQWEKKEYIITDEREAINPDIVVSLLKETYWASDRPAESILDSFKTSLCFSIFHKNTQVGFGRVVTDKAVFSWIADIIIHPDHQGRGLGKFLMEIICNHPDVKNTRKMLKTKDAHGLYRKFGFADDVCMIQSP